MPSAAPTPTTLDELTDWTLRADKVIAFSRYAHESRTGRMRSRISHDSYDTHAGGYASELDPTLVGPVERVVELARVGPGVRVLDLATGTGAIARAAAAREGSVVGIDASSGMIEVARSISPRLDLRLADASALPFADGIFDVVTCGLSISHFDDREKALGEVMRVLQPGGRFVASAWSDGGTGPTRTAFRILSRYAEPDGGLDEETWATGHRGTAAFREAGFTCVSVQVETFTGEFANAEDALAWTVAWPLAATRLERLDPPRREDFFSAVRAALAKSSLAWTFALNFYVAYRPSAR